MEIVCSSALLATSFSKKLFTSLEKNRSLYITFVLRIGFFDDVCVENKQVLTEKITKIISESSVLILSFVNNFNLFKASESFRTLKIFIKNELNRSIPK